MWEYTFGLHDYDDDEIALTRATYDATVLELDTMLERLLDSLDPELRELMFVRASLILVRFESAWPFELTDVRSPGEAEAIVRELYERQAANRWAFSEFRSLEDILTLPVIGSRLALADAYAGVPGVG